MLLLLGVGVDFDTMTHGVSNDQLEFVSRDAMCAREYGLRLVHAEGVDDPAAERHIGNSHTLSI